MTKLLFIVLLSFGLALTVQAAHSQVATTKDQIKFYTSDWKGDRFPDGRPKISDDLLTRALDVSIEDVWDFLEERGYHCQFDGDWKALHSEKPFAGRALTAQYMPLRPDMAKAIAAEGEPSTARAAITAGRSRNCNQAMCM